MYSIVKGICFEKDCYEKNSMEIFLQTFHKHGSDFVFGLTERFLHQDKKGAFICLLIFGPHLVFQGLLPVWSQ